MVEFLCRINFNGRINLTTTRTTMNFICKAIKESYSIAKALEFIFLPIFCWFGHL